MLLLALKNLIQERTKLAICVGGVAAAIILILVLDGIFVGMEDQLTAYIAESPADLWVMQKGVSNMHMANTRMAADFKLPISNLKGVKEISTILYVNGLVKVGDSKSFSYIVGYDPNEPAGGPWLMVKGRKDIKKNEVVVDSVLAKKNNLRIGDKIEVLGQRLTVAGLSGGTYSMANTVTFLNRQTLAKITSSRGVASYFLITLDSNVNPDRVAADIKKVGPINVVSKNKFVANDKKMVKQMGIDIIYAMSFVGLLIGLIVVGLTVYTVTLAKTRDYGILKAIGANKKQLYQVVFWQSFFSVAMGLVLGIFGSLVVASLVYRFLPELPVIISGLAVQRAFIAMAAIGLIASYIPVRKVAKIDPMLVFRR